MAVSGRQTNTMEEYLQKILRLITDAKIAPDSDLAFLVELETMILQYMRAPLEQAGVDTSMMSATAGGPPMQSGDMAGFTPQGGQGVPGLAMGPTAPNPDELRRLLTQ